MSYVELRNICKEYNGFSANKDISFEIEKGSLTALLGPSGSGKTTLLNCLGLILPVDSGEVLVDNTDATRWREAQRAAFWRESASFIYQDYGIIDDESVSFNVSLRKIGSNQRQINEVLKTVGLSGREKDRAMVLSGGEKQRLGIARAIYKNASVIFADEPTASLDEANRNLVISLLRDCANRGVAVILATHDERLVKECEEVVVLGK